ncbi:hypothetical protein [Leifsonia sp. Root4]|uniref:hypothetical protein n=1 Tax=Leifsonia sp. Root4 TaxID=1736525 RepID=UPI0012F764AE|nr:hypothetical protein [Leifsonia sp. Root4]
MLFSPATPASSSLTPWLRHPAAAAMRLGGAVTLVLALGMMWSARIVFDGNTYVSGLGAHSEITAVAFNISLGLVAAGGALCAGGLWGPGRGRGLLGAWAVSTSLLAASSMFAVGATVPCSTSCPIPLTPAAGMQDLVHTTAAVIGFAFAGVAILQTLRIDRSYALLAAPSILLVIVASATGGILSLAGAATALGGWLELIATTAALLWLAGVAAVTHRRVIAADAVRASSTLVPHRSKPCCDADLSWGQTGLTVEDPCTATTHFSRQSPRSTDRRARSMIPRPVH